MSRFPSFLIAALCCLFCGPLLAETKVPSIIGSHMVLQREKVTPVWGWDNAGQKVTVTFNGQSATTTTDSSGRWQVNLKPMKAGGPLSMSIEGSSRIQLENILVGEVWLCSGQSNMEWTVKISNNPKEEIAAANYPKIRHIKIPHRPSDKPESNVPSQGWKVCSPKTAGDFTAVGYYFGRQLHKELNVPIGLIGSNWGGTRIEPWTPPEGFKKVPALKASHADKLDSFPAKNGNRINHQSPLALYNGMIHPLLPFSIKGAIWYQGESNNGEGMLYHEKMKALIHGWREVWNTPDLPFYFVQLAPFKYGNAAALPFIWEAQEKTLSVPHTGMAVTTDISNIRDIHPRNKQDVGRRLALWALKHDYGRSELVCSGPTLESMKIEGNQARLSFGNIGKGLTTRDGKAPSHFTIAGEDRKFVEAKARIDGNQVVVTAEGVSKPVAVRFGWDQLAEPNFGNREGLPASPFRTDSWKK